MLLPTQISSDLPLPPQLSEYKQARIRQVVQQTLEQARIRYLANSFSEWSQLPTDDAGEALSRAWVIGASDFTREVVSHVQSKVEGKRGASFSGHSLKVLEEAFARTPFLNKSECAMVARAAALSSRQVRTWFQNKRNRVSKPAASARKKAKKDCTSRMGKNMNKKSSEPTARAPGADPQHATVGFDGAHLADEETPTPSASDGATNLGPRLGYLRSTLETSPLRQGSCEGYSQTPPQPLTLLPLAVDGCRGDVHQSETKVWDFDLPSTDEQSSLTPQPLAMFGDGCMTDLSMLMTMPWVPPWDANASIIAKGLYSGHV